MPDLVILDTMICIWAFKGEASPGQQEKVREARAFIEYLDEEGYEVGISAVTLSELMVAVKDADRQALREACRTPCACSPSMLAPRSKLLAFSRAGSIRGQRTPKAVRS